MTIQFRIRPAAAEDHSTIKAMVRGEGLNPLGLHWPQFFVATDPAGQIIGCAQVKSHRGNVRELASLVIEKQWRGYNLARALITHCQKDTGPPLWLMCRAGLVPFYRRFGFEDVTQQARLPAYYGRIRRLARLFSRLSRSGEGLAVMCWAGSHANTSYLPSG